MSKVPKDLIALARLGVADNYVIAWSDASERAYVFDVDRAAKIATLVHTYHRPIRRKTIQRWQWGLQDLPTGGKLVLCRLVTGKGSWTIRDPRRGAEAPGEFFVGHRQGIPAVPTKP